MLRFEWCDKEVNDFFKHQTYILLLWITGLLDIIGPNWDFIKAFKRYNLEGHLQNQLRLFLHIIIWYNNISFILNFVQKMRCNLSPKNVVKLLVNWSLLRASYFRMFGWNRRASGGIFKTRLVAATYLVIYVWVLS